MGTAPGRSAAQKRGGQALSSWTPQRVLDAATAMAWRPDGAIEMLTADYRLIRYPDWALDPAFPAAQVTRSRAGRTRRPAGEVIDEVAARVRGWGLRGVAWWVSSATLPPDTEQVLRARGGKRIDAVQILGRSGKLIAVEVPQGRGVPQQHDDKGERATRGR